MNVAVVGAGKMGLPIACQVASQGASVMACDINEALVAMINAGRCPIDEPGLTELLEAGVAAGRLRATTNLADAAAASDVVIVMVPVLLTPEREADLTQIHAVARLLGATLKRGAMVVFETTLPVGTTRSLLPLLEAHGRKRGVDFDLVFSPERVKSRLVLKHLTETPKVVAGLDAKATARAADFYSKYLGAPVIEMESLEASELTKIAGMVYRDVNIALANELARYSEAVGVDFGPVAAAANTDGEAFLLTPGIGVGGHCTPVYPYFLTKDARRRDMPARLTELSRTVNDDQPDRTIAALEETWRPVKGSRVMVLGLGFRPEVKEHTCSPAFAVRDALQQRGAKVELFDPLYTPQEIEKHGFTSGALDADPAPAVLVLVTAHDAFRKLDFRALASRGIKAVVDGRNAWDPRQVRDAGLIYVGVGRAVDARREAHAR